MTEQKPDFLPPDPDTRVSEALPDRLQEWAVTAGKKLLEHAEKHDTLMSSFVDKVYRDQRIAIAQRVADEEGYLPPVDGPLRFEVMTPLETDEKGEEVPRKTWYFLSDQYLRCLASGVYPISNHGNRPNYHDATHAAEISILQKYTPAISQLMIDAATHAVKEDETTQKTVTELIDYFTDTFILDRTSNDRFSMNMFEWRASSLYRVINQDISPEELKRKTQALALETVSGLTRYAAETSVVEE